jgi:hypothetical protein
MFFASCAGTENKTSTDALSSQTRHLARHSSIAVPPRWGGGLDELRISSICTTILADSGEGVLLRQSDNAVVFFPITCDACSASPPLCKTGRYATIHSSRPQLTSHIESPCQCQLFEGSPPNPFEPPSPSVLHTGRHAVLESMPTRLPFRLLSTNLLQARCASWTPVLTDVGGHVM